MAEWNKVAEIDYTDLTIRQINVDTRDFHGTIIRNGTMKITRNYSKNTAKRFKEKFVYTLEEVGTLLVELQEKTGGDCTWRMLTFPANKEHSGWDLKYLLIDKIDENEYVIVSKTRKVDYKKEIWQGELLPKSLWKTEHDKQALCAH